MNSKFDLNRPMLGLAFLFFAAVALIAGQKQDVAAAGPQNPDAGRIRTLTPILTITDDGGAFYFKRPFLPQFGPDGSIYVLDKEQILRFDAEGRFVRNYFRKGQGPGELNFVPGFAATESYLIVRNIAPGKIVRFDSEGKFFSETPIVAAGASLLFTHAVGQSAFFLKDTFNRKKLSEMKRMEGILESANPIIAIPLEGGPEKQVGSFSTRTYVRKSEEGSAATLSMGKYLIAPWGENVLAISDSDDYAVELLDTKTGSVIRVLRRTYPRVKTPPEYRDGIPGGVMIGDQEIKIPAPKYTADIVNLLARGEELWVVTSTRVKEKGVLVDVFDREGIYTDSFYLPIPEWPEKHLTRPDPLAIQGDFLLTLEKTEEETYVLRKYRLGK